MTTNSKKTTLRQTSGNRVQIRYYDESADCGAGAMVEREFSVRSDGKAGYVNELDGRGGSRQVCDGLYGSGNTLMATADTLLATIRREWQARRRHEAALERSR